MKTTSDYNFIQVYQIWVNGRDIDNVDQHFPIETNIGRKDWHSDLKKAVKDYFKAKSIHDKDYPYLKDAFQDYIVTLFSIEIDIHAFEKKYAVKFDLNDEFVQKMIPYFIDYNFNTVAERIANFK